MKNLGCFGYKFKTYSKQEIVEYLNLIAENSVPFNYTWSSSDVQEILKLFMLHSVINVSPQSFIVSVPNKKNTVFDPNVWIEDATKFIFFHVNSFLKEKCVIRYEKDDEIYELFKIWLETVDYYTIKDLKLNEFSMEFFSKNFKKLI